VELDGANSIPMYRRDHPLSKSVRRSQATNDDTLACHCAERRVEYLRPLHRITDDLKEASLQRKAGCQAVRHTVDSSLSR
jgi:hypothetical protein